MLAVAVISTVCYLRIERSPYARYLVNIFQEIEFRALEPPGPETLFDGAVTGMVDLLDEHSSYISEQNAPQFKAELEQEFGGVGVVVSMVGEPPQLTVVSSPLYGTPAHDAGIRAQDVILAIDDDPTDGLSMGEVLQKMRGSRGEAITLTIRHEKESVQEDVTLVREVIKIPSVLGDIRKENGDWDFHVAGDPTLGYVRVVSFGEKTTGELESVVAGLEAERVRGLILDLRENPGGLLSAAVDVCDLFLPGGELVVSVESRYRKESISSTHGEMLAGVPIVILVNENGASASEIVAGCLQDHRRAVVAGDRSFGKGTVQDLIEIESGRSILKLTVARYLRPSGRNIHRGKDAKEEDEWGVTPEADLRVVLTDDEYETWADARRRRDLNDAKPPTAEDDHYDWDPQLRRAIDRLLIVSGAPAADGS